MQLTQSETTEQTDTKPVTGAFTVDVEDYFQVTAFEKHVPREKWSEFESRVERNTHRILELLDRRSVRGTFFVLGWVARHYPGIVRDIHNAGHEIGSHSYWHRLVYELTPDQFREDLRQSRDELAGITGQPVISYRAPTFSITARSTWALEILVEEGFRVDSSVFPIYHDRYGMPNASREIHQMKTKSGSIWEFPPTVARVARFNLPAGGGGYFRLYPFSLTRYCLHQVVRKTDHPFMFYVHPWEVDPDQPRLHVSTAANRFRHYVNLSKTQQKLDRLLQEFSFGRISDIIPLTDSNTSNHTK